MTFFIIGLILGAVIDNVFAPKIKFTNNGISIEWTNKTKKP